MPPNNSSQGSRNVLGPYSILSKFGPEPQSFGVQIPFGNICGSNILITIDDNFDDLISAVNLPLTFLAEVAIVGFVYGTETCIKKSMLNKLNGPMQYIFSQNEKYEMIEVKARNMGGGASGNTRFTTEPTYSGKPHFANLNISYK
jgi:hypothetical protein